MSSPRPLSRHPLLALSFGLVLAWCLGESYAQLARRGRGWDVVAEGLRAEDDEELLRRALGPDYVPFAALRDHVPGGLRVVLVGTSTASAGFYQRAETMLYPRRFAAARPQDFVDWQPPADGPARDVYVLVYDASPVDFGRWFERVDTGSDARLYRLRARARQEGD